ncbi:MAG: formate dehydrogenase accessory protein FdhE [Chitinophagales bacterium]
MIEKKPVTLPEGYVDFYKNVETWQNEVFFRLKKRLSQNKIDAKSILSEENRPLVELVDLDLNQELYHGAIIEFIDIVKNQRKLAQDKLDQISRAIEGLDYTDLAIRVISNDQEFISDLARKNDLAEDLLIFVLDHALRPFLRYFALPYQDSLLADENFSWNDGDCPVCGFKANFSRVRAEDGRRFLFCEHCFTEWEYKYLGCIYCGNSEPNTIRYFIVEGDDANQVFVCDKCRGYLKTFDERKGQRKEDLFIAGIETVYLDLIAEEEGYSTKVDLNRDLN